MTDTAGENSTSLDSPCIRNCCLDEQDICLGCYRSIEEITGWYKASDMNKHEILARCAHRKAAKAQSRSWR